MTIIQNTADIFCPVFTTSKYLAPVGGSASTSYLYEAIITTTTGASSKPVFSINQNELEPVTITCNAGINTTNYPQLTTANEFTGTHTFRLDNAQAGYQLSLNFTTLTGVTTSECTGILNTAGSYLTYSKNWLFGLLANGANLEVYSGSARNANCWLASEDITGIPFSNSNGGPGGGQKNGALITRRHMVGARHLRLNKGDTVTFKTASGVNFTKSIIGVSSDPTPSTDAIIYLLSEDLPNTIKHYPVAGRWIYLKETGSTTYTTCSQFVGVFINQYKRAGFVHRVEIDTVLHPKTTYTLPSGSVQNCLPSITYDASDPSEHLPPQLKTYENLRKDSVMGYPQGVAPRVGDSGSTVFVKVSSGLAVISSFSSFLIGPFWDESLANFLIASADLDAGISTGYTVTVAPDPTL